MSAHLAVWVEDVGRWECAAVGCDFMTVDDSVARCHGMTGVDRMLDEMEVPD